MWSKAVDLSTHISTPPGRQKFSSAACNLPAPCGEVREIASHHLEHVRTKIADLVEIERLLAKTIERCSGMQDAECPVIAMIEKPEASQHRQDA